MRILLLILLFLPMFLTGQEIADRILKGKIVEQGEPIIGVAVWVEDSQADGVVSDVNGVFELMVPGGKSCWIQLGICLNATRPDPIRIKKDDQEILLRLGKKGFRKKTKKKIGD